MWDTWLYLTLLGLSTGGYCLSFSKLSIPLRWLAFHQLVTFIATVSALAYIYVVKQHNNLFVFHWLTIFQYGLLAGMFARVLPGKTTKQLIQWSVPLFTGIALLFALTVQPWNQLNSYAATFFNLLISLLSGSYIWSTFTDNTIKRIEREPLFWISAGLFFTSLGNFFVQGLLNYLLARSEKAALTVYWVEELMGMLLTLLFIVALLAHKRWIFNS